MKAIHINQKNKQLVEVDLATDEYGVSLAGMYDLCDCELVECVSTTIGGVPVTIWVDEEGLFKPGDFFCVDGYPTPLKGSGIILGATSLEGESTECPISLEHAMNGLRFVAEQVVEILNAVGRFSR